MRASASGFLALSGLLRANLRRRELHERPWPVKPGVNVLSLIGVLGFSGTVLAAPTASERSTVRLHSYKLPLTFEINQGQTDGRIDFLARGDNYTLFLTATEAVFALSRPGIATPQASKRQATSDTPRMAGTVLRMQLVDSARDAQIQGLEELPGKVNYLRGNDSAQWLTNVRTYKRVKYTAVYPGIDLIYYGRPQQLEYDFEVAPGADPSTIKLAFAGVDDATVDARGDLVLNATDGHLLLQKPVIYQLDGVRRETVEGGYVHKSTQQIGFRVGAYDRARPLIIDPVLSYATYLGGSGEDRGEGIAVDASGAAYVVGSTTSTDFPTTNALQPTQHGGNQDVFVAKLTADGTALVYATYLGGSGIDGGSSIAVDSVGVAYITGQTSSTDFPTVRALQGSRRGEIDAFVAKLSSNGSQLIYSTYLGGNGEELDPAIAVDPTGAAYVTGITTSPNFPAVSAFQPASIDVLCEPLTCSDAFVAKLIPDGSALAYSTYLGGSGPDFGLAIAVDSHGAAYVAGDTRSVDFPAVNPLQPHTGFEQDANAFVTKFAPSGRTLVYSTYLGGSRFDRAVGIAVDASGAAYVTGDTDSSDFPTENALQPVYGDGRDIFVAKLPPEGGRLVYATYLGGNNFDVGNGIAVDAAGAAYVTGTTFSPDFPTVKPMQPTCASCVVAGASDAIVAKLRPDGAGLLHSTFLGGSSLDEGSSIAVDLMGAAYVTGATHSLNFPTVQPLQATVRGADAFVTKFSVADPPLPPHVVVNPESTDFPAEPRDIKFGEAVAIRNGIAFVGIPKAADGGHVAVLNLTAGGWKRSETIKLPEPVIQATGETGFGRVLTWRDGVLIVGGNQAAYYFSRRNGIWTFHDILRPESLSPGSVFPVALRYERGDVNIAGSPQLHGVGTLLASEFAAPCCASRVHVFHLSPTRQSFLYVDSVQAVDSRAGDNFGADLSMTNRAFVVGSPRGSRRRIAGLPAYDQSGAAYIFRRGTDGRWKQGQKLLPSEPAPGFGTSVAIDNDMIIVGAPKIDIEGLPASPATPDGHTAGGAAYVFVPGIGRYVQARKLRPRPDELFQYQDFGYRVAMFGPHVAIGAARPYAPDGLFPFGLVVPYTRDGTSLLPHGIVQGHVVAASMGLANNWLLLGVPYERSCPSGCVGSAHIYDMNRLPP